MSTLTSMSICRAKESRKEANPSCISIPFLGLPDFDETGMSSTPIPHWCVLVAGEDVHRAPAVDPLVIGLVPHAVVDAHHPRHDALRDLGLDHQRSPIIEHPYPWPIMDAPRLGIDRAYPHG